MDRRKFLQRSLLSTIWLWLSGQAHAATQEKPNILWLTSEDHGPHLGCYGDLYADTPNLDKLAARGMLFKRAWSTAPVCAAARTALISGIYPPSLGAEHMRSLVSLPAFMKMYPQYLREAGYYCSNNAKEDYNLVEPGQVWDDSSGDAHWRNRGSGQPFFSVFNFGMTHESQIRAADANTVHELAGVRVPAYQPDTPEVRSNWAQYYDRITQLDSAVAEALSALEQARLSEDTIVFFFSDHGSGFPRSKRWPFNSGLHVPMIVYFPDKWRHLAPAEYAPGAQSERLVDFMDLAPTLLSLIGTEPPAYLHGHAFAGGFQSKPPDYLYAFRGRMDERYDMVRTVTDGRYIYLRHYMPHKIYGQHVSYMFETQATQVWKRMFDEGRLNAAQSRFWESKPPEELYDLDNDPDEIDNLANSPAHQQIVRRLRREQQEWVLQSRDFGFLPEAEIHNRSQNSTPYEVAQDDELYPLARIVRTADLAASLDIDAVDELIAVLADADSAVRYWGVLGLLMRQAPAVSSARDHLLAALSDSSASVRVTAAEALGRYGSGPDIDAALEVLLEHAAVQANGEFIAMLAVAALDAMEERALGVQDRIAAIDTTGGTGTRPTAREVERLIAKTLADLGAR